MTRIPVDALVRRLWLHLVSHTLPKPARVRARKRERASDIWALPVHQPRVQFALCNVKAAAGYAAMLPTSMSTTRRTHIARDSGVAHLLL